LGREKEGIPAEYLGLLDGCVEIPQFGVTRYGPRQQCPAQWAPLPEDSRMIPSIRGHGACEMPQVPQRPRERRYTGLGVHAPAGTRPPRPGQCLDIACSRHCTDATV